MQSVDLVIADIAWLITMDRDRRVIRDAAIAVDNGKIVAVGKSADLAQRYAGKSPALRAHVLSTPHPPTPAAELAPRPHTIGGL